MPVTTLKDVLRHELGDIYDAEQLVLSILDRFETDTRDRELRDRIRQHREETHRHIQNLERCFELLGTGAPRVQCAAVRGLRDGIDRFRADDPSPAAREAFNLDAADKTEHYAIGSYRGLLDLALTLEQHDIRRLLQQNLQDDEAMCRWIRENQPRILGELRGLRAR